MSQVPNDDCAVKTPETQTSKTASDIPGDAAAAPTATAIAAGTSAASSDVKKPEQVTAGGITFDWSTEEVSEQEVQLALDNHRREFADQHERDHMTPLLEHILRRVMSIGHELKDIRNGTRFLGRVMGAKELLESVFAKIKTLPGVSTHESKFVVPHCTHLVCHSDVVDEFIKYIEASLKRTHAPKVAELFRQGDKPAEHVFTLVTQQLVTKVKKNTVVYRGSEVLHTINVTTFVCTKRPDALLHHAGDAVKAWFKKQIEHLNGNVDIYRKLIEDEKRRDVTNIAFGEDGKKLQANLADWTRQAERHKTLANAVRMMCAFLEQEESNFLFKTPQSMCTYVLPRVGPAAEDTSNAFRLTDASQTILIEMDEKSCVAGASLSKDGKASLLRVVRLIKNLEKMVRIESPFVLPPVCMIGVWVNIPVMRLPNHWEVTVTASLDVHVGDGKQRAAANASFLMLSTEREDASFGTPSRLNTLLDGYKKMEQEEARKMLKERKALVKKQMEQDKKDAEKKAAETAAAPAAAASASNVAVVQSAAKG